jgi:tripartite-type tricarboxylate transporter receptor subunit TctC
MVKRKVDVLVGIACLLAALMPWHAAHAQAYPARPVQLVIPFPPGGATDIVGRLVGKKLGERLGQSVVIENKAGAGTVIGAAFVANAPADGYTLLISSGSTFTVNPAINHKLPYDPVKSFEPIGGVARVPLILVANRDVSVNDLAQLIATVRAAPDKYVYGSFGNGTTGHFAAEQLWQTLGIKLAHVPYKGWVGRFRSPSTPWHRRSPSCRPARSRPSPSPALPAPASCPPCRPWRSKASGASRPTPGWPSSHRADFRPR